MNRIRLGLTAAILLAGGGLSARAQTTPPAMPGAQVRITHSASAARLPGELIAVSPLRGELIAVSPDTLWLLAKSTLLRIPSRDIRQVDVKVRPIGAEGILLWGAIGGAVSGVALYGACASYTDDCGAVLPVTVLVWGLWSGLWAAVAGSAYAPHSPDWFGRSELRAFARFPQGLPSAFDPVWLRATPDTTAGSRHP